MFIYENGNSLNLTFKGTMPVENPDIIIKGYVNGASLTVNGTELVSVADAVEFEGKARLFVYQKDGKLNITFNGIDGMNNPEVTLDETTKGVVTAVVNGTTVTINYDENGVIEQTSEQPVETPVVNQPEQVEEPENVVEEPEDNGEQTEE